MELIMAWMTNLSVEASSIFIQNRAFGPAIYASSCPKSPFSGHLALVTPGSVLLFGRYQTKTAMRALDKKRQ